MKECLDEYLRNKEKNKDKVKLTFDQWRDVLFDYCNTHSQVPSKKTKHKNTNIGQWLQSQKKKINATTDDTYQKLAIHPLVKECLDEYLRNKEKNKGNVKLTFDQWRDILFDHCNTHSQVPTWKTKHKNTNIGKWLNNQKAKLTAATDNLYQKLAIHPIVKDCLDDYLHNKEKNKDKVKLTFDQSRDNLFDYCNTYSQVPSKKTKHKNTNIGSWLHTQKKKINATTDDTYQQLATHPIVKAELDKYLTKKHKKHPPPTT